MFTLIFKYNVDVQINCIAHR